MATNGPLDPAVILPTRCRICGHQFPSNPLHSAALINANPQAKLQQLQAVVSPLMKHLNKKHPRELEWTQLVGGEYAGLLAMNMFDCGERIVEDQRDYTRWKIHTLTRRAHVSDERIVERVRQAFLSHWLYHHHLAQAAHGMASEQEASAAADHWMKGTLAAAIIDTLKQMRNVLEELGRYQMTDPPPTMDAAQEPSADQPTV